MKRAHVKTEATISKPVPQPARRLNPLALSLLAAGLLWPATHYAQLLQDASPIQITESVLSSVLFARSVSTELELRRLSLRLLEATQTVTAAEDPFASGLKLSPAGTVSTSPGLFPAGSDFFRLPAPLQNQTDANGNPLAYCAYDFRGTPATGLNGRMAGKTQTGGAPDANAVSFAIISPGNNGRFEFRCADLVPLSPGDAKQPSFPITPGRRDYDDVVYILTNAEATYGGMQQQNTGAAIETYTQLTQLTGLTTGGSAAVNQIRWVKQLRQFFIATAAIGSGFTWEPLTPSARASFIAGNQAQFSYLSGGMGIGSENLASRTAVTGLEGADRTASLTLGSQRSRSDATLENGQLAAGIALRDINQVLRTYIGLGGSGEQDFVVRHTNTANLTRDRIRVTADGRLWMGDVPATPAATPASASSLFGTVSLGSDGLGSAFSPYIFFGNTLAAQNAVSRFFLPTHSSNMPIFEIGLLSQTGAIGNGHVVFNTGGNVGIGFSGLTAADTPQYRLDVRGSARFSGPVLFESDAEIRGRLIFSGDLQANTATFNGEVNARNGFNAGNGTFTNRLAVGGGAVIAGGLQVSDGLTVGSGVLSAGEGVFTGRLIARDGLESTFATLSGDLGVTGAARIQGNAVLDRNLVVGGDLTVRGASNLQGLTLTGHLQGTSATFTGLLDAQGGLRSTTGEFSSDLTVGGNSTISGNVDVAGNARFRSNVDIDGNLNVRGRLNFPNVVTLNFTGVTGDRNSGLATIGSGQFTVNTGSIDIHLAHANQNLYSINQGLGTGSSPSFHGLTIGNGGMEIEGTVKAGKFDGLSTRLDKTLKLNFRDSSESDVYATATFDLRNTGDQTLDVYVARFDNRDYRSVTATANSTFNVTCNINGSTQPDCGNTQFDVVVRPDQNSFLQGNNYSSQGSITIDNRGTTASGPAPSLASPIELSVTGDFLDGTQTVFLNTGSVRTLNLTSRGLSHATRMNQDVRTDSTVTFQQLTLTNGGIFNGTSSMTELTVSNSAAIRNILQIENGSGQVRMQFNGNDQTASIGSVIINGASGQVTAARFAGTADRADRLSRDLQFNFSGILSGTATTTDGFNYTLNTAFSNESVTSAMLANGSVTSDKIVNEAISTVKLQNAAVTTVKLANGSVTSDKLADGAVISSKLADGSVISSKLGDAAVTTAKIANGAVTSTKLAVGATIDNARNLVSSSDLRLKHSVSRVDGSTLLQRLSGVLLYGYQFNDDPLQQRQLGVIAQELQPLFPELVQMQTDGQHTGFYGVNYGVLGAVSAAGVGELNRKLEALGLQRRSTDTLQASLPNFVVTHIEGQNARFKRVNTDEIEARDGRFERLDARQFTTDRSRTRQLQADTLNSGAVEGYAMGAGLSLFSASSDGHWIVQVSASDGSHAAASVFVAGGVVTVVPMSGHDISITAHAGTVYAVAAGKALKASWLKTG